MSAVHVMPVNDLITHEAGQECVCVPDLEAHERGNLWVHHSLDGRELSE